ncbi:hypothetical protein I7I53_09554 [Histoplasma capsulatum var. duboisii H88]|uniref:Uncharacterized protein n=1 Tax=Ajellomyces capsulatus (strain H88) TaxID=544711 RepID=A0A8A1L568_AJEC8|nr:hypothetical protein I7I53_09554 [Histoplasma capsulatum var. duboisii H88]
MTKVLKRTASTDIYPRERVILHFRASCVSLAPCPNLLLGSLLSPLMGPIECWTELLTPLHSTSRTFLNFSTLVAVDVWTIYFLHLKIG